MAKDKEKKPDGAFQQGSGEPDDGEDTAEPKQFAGGNRGIQDDKSQGSDADHGQRGARVILRLGRAGLGALRGGSGRGGSRRRGRRCRSSSATTR